MFHSFALPLLRSSLFLVPFSVSAVQFPADLFVQRVSPGPTSAGEPGRAGLVDRASNATIAACLRSPGRGRGPGGRGTQRGVDVAMGSKSGSPSNRMRHVLSALVQNQPGVLAHVSGMFASRGFNIESLAVGETEDAHLSRITVVVNGDDRLLEQIRKQLEKIVTVVKVLDISRTDFVERDLMLIKIDAPPSQTARAPGPGPDLPGPDRRRRPRPDDGRDLRPGEEDRGVHRRRPPLRDPRAGPDRPDRHGPRHCHRPPKTPRPRKRPPRPRRSIGHSSL